ncbi:MAG: carbon-phosphorus lyase complex subunit PhnI [Planctomycetota bacterium]
MSYVAIKGGENAMREAAALLQVLRTRGSAQGQPPLSPQAIEHQLHFLHSQVMSEGGLYDAPLAALAVKQSLGDPMEAAFLLRASRSTRPRIADTPVIDTRKMRLIRRISSAFKDIPGGQILGPTPDYTQRLFDWGLLDESDGSFRDQLARWSEGLGADPKDTADDPPLPKVLDFLRERGLVDDAPEPGDEPFDITREPLVFPVDRSAALATLTRGQQGGVVALAYSNMRGYGDVHPTIAELRVGYVPVELPHPVTGEPAEAGEVLITECEVIAMYERSEEASARRSGVGDTVEIDPETPPRFTLGYGACFGHNEAKAIAMAILDRSLQKGMRDGATNPSEDPEFVLLHVDGIDAMGFTVHYKMPHYVTFASDLDRLRKTQRQHADKPRAAAAGSPVAEEVASP